MKPKINWKVVLTGIICLTAIEITALLKGINGTLLATIIAAIALAIGIVIPNPIKN